MVIYNSSNRKIIYFILPGIEAPNFFFFIKSINIKNNGSTVSIVLVILH